MGNRMCMIAFSLIVAVWDAIVLKELMDIANKDSANGYEVSMPQQIMIIVLSLLLLVFIFVAILGLLQISL